MKNIKKMSKIASGSIALFAMISVFLFIPISFVSASPAVSFPATIDLSSLDGTLGFVVNGGAEETGGSSLNSSSAGDINGDGIGDFIVGSPDSDVNGVTDAGQVYVVFGNTNGFPAQLNSFDLNGTDGFIVNGISGNAGVSVSAAGDVNGDGFGDVIIGAWNASPDDKILAGQAYVIFGTNQGFPRMLELSSLDGSGGFTIDGIAATDFLGISVAAAGDVNGDGISDLVIGANGRDRNGLPNVGQAYVIFGKNTGFPATIDPASLNGTNGFAFNGEIAAFENTGRSVSSGDVNGDGLGDVIVGAPSTVATNFDTRGRAYIVFGTKEGFPAVIDFLSLDGSNGFFIRGFAEGDFTGESVASADINGDGFDDVVVGAQGASPNGISNAGQTHVVFGKERGFPPTVELSSLDGSNGFVLNGIAANDFSGITVSPAGDVNGDSRGDIVIGAPFASPNQNRLAGESYVVFGADSFPATLELSSLDGSNGFTLNGGAENNHTGSSAASAGDVNGDGVGDLVIGSQFSAEDPDAPGQSQVYVVFGQSSSARASAVTYVSTRTGGTLGDLSFADEDILAYNADTKIWSLHFDGSDVGLGELGVDVNAVHINEDDSILMSFKHSTKVPGIGLVDDVDIVRFVPISTGSDSAGTFEIYFDGSDVGLVPSHKGGIDAIGFLPDGRLVISTARTVKVAKHRSKDEDLLVFAATELGSITRGSFDKFFDGSDVGLKDGRNQEDVNGTWIGKDGAIYLTTKGSFSVYGLTGGPADIFKCVPDSTGRDTSCTFSLHFDGSEEGLEGHRIDAFHLAH